MPTITPASSDSPMILSVLRFMIQRPFPESQYF